VSILKRLTLLMLVVLVLAGVVGFIGVRMRFPVRYLAYVEAHAGELDASWILAVIMAESSFRQQARSPQGAQGLMQLMPATATWVAGLMGKTDFDPASVWDPAVNIALGSFYLNWLYQRFGGDITLMLAAYNAGQGNVQNWLNNPELSPDGATLDSIPFTETHYYVQRVRFNQRVYRFILRFYR